MKDEALNISPGLPKSRWPVPGAKALEKRRNLKWIVKRR